MKKCAWVRPELVAQVILIGGSHPDLPEFFVLHRVCRVIAHGVLAPQFFGDLIECLHQFLFGRQLDGPSAGFVRQLLRHIGPPRKAWIVYQQHMHNGVGPLRGLVRFVQLQLATFVLGIRILRGTLL
jgi:hypothetical protein